MTTREKADKLEVLSDYEGTEKCDVWRCLIHLYNYKEYITEDFWLEVGVEIEIQYQEALDMIEDGEIEVDEELKRTLV